MTFAVEDEAKASTAANARGDGESLKIPAALVGQGRIAMPKAASQIASVANFVKVHLRINVRAGLWSQPAGNFVDGILGATAIERGAILITADKALIKAVQALCNETLKQNAYNLTTPQSLIVHGLTVGTMARIAHRDRINGLRIKDSDGRKIDLPSAVDIGEQLEEPRVFIIEGVDPKLFFVFGGEISFWVSTDLTEIARLDLFRETRLEEYWTTTVLEQPRALIFIYETGVLAIDERLQVLMHQEKFINDFFLAIEDNTLKFVRDHEEEWLMPLDYALQSGS